MILSKEIERKTKVAVSIDKKDGATVSFQELADWMGRVDYFETSHSQMQGKVDESERKYEMVQQDRERLKSDLARGSSELVQVKNKLRMVEKELNKMRRSEY